MEPYQDHVAGSPALCQGYPGAILPAEGVGPLLGLTQALFNDQPIGQRGSALKWPRGYVDEGPPLLPGRHHLNLQPGCTPSPIYVPPHSKQQGAQTVGVDLSVISSTRELRWIQIRNRE
ncbi:hypothetical protein PoB_005424400 [Plakobranchus ocellatus]|uniref:Uncharacterized protein n=1 Tax=Plakobranchus ocellatus TaxID=259542 RepID=A0AAV4C5A6_9GAST|nr:hypothetical protein PoB_005424400 [Plakobranchus ocellatus]